MSTEFSKLHQAARDFALAGIPVFPCVEGGKAPVVTGGFHQATTDLEQIDAWWNANPNYNIGVPPGRVGWCVIDLDPPVGEQSWAALLADNGGAPDTFEVRTPRGGRHLYFAGTLPPSVQKLGEKIDTRGEGSYVLAPPSYLSKNAAFYEVLKDVEVAPLPQWISDLAGRTRERMEADVVELDTPGATARVIAFLVDLAERGEVAVEGQGGNHRTYQVAAKCRDLGVSEPHAVELLQNHFNPHCLPPWSDEELQTIISNAYAYGQNDPGAYAVPSPSEIWPALDKLSSTEGEARRSKFYPHDESEQDNQPTPQWLLPDLLPDNAIVMMFGDSGSFKSFIALHMAMVLSTGLRKLGYEGEAVDVVYAAGEGPRSIATLRRPAWKHAHLVEGPTRFSLINDVPMVALPEQVDEFCKAIDARSLKPRLVVIDTVARAMTGMNENDARDAGIFVAAIEKIKRQFSCTVLVIHHGGKQSERGARGSSALTAGFDAVLEVKADKVTKAVAVHCRKQKDADERVAPWTFQGKPVASSLVFTETDAETHAALTASEDVFEPRKIGTALAELKAYGLDRGITSHVLVTHMLPADPDDSPEQRHQIIGAHVAQLRKLAKEKALRGYFERSGRELLWCLPAPPDSGTEDY